MSDENPMTQTSQAPNAPIKKTYTRDFLMQFKNLAPLQDFPKNAVTIPGIFEPKKLKNK
ncbi:MAG: hypothetical protein AB7I18_03275 [Candidatus Berkiella sp.]